MCQLASAYYTDILISYFAFVRHQCNRKYFLRQGEYGVIMSLKNDDNQDQPGMNSRMLIKRLLKLAWKYRRGCLKVVALQVVLLTLGMLGLGLSGVGVDYVRYQLALKSPDAVAGVIAPKLPRWPFGIVPPDDWSPMIVVGLISAVILILAGIRTLLNISYAICMNDLVQGKIVVDLRGQVFRKMQKLSFRFFDANASGTIINRVTGDVQAVRSFVDGVVIQSLIVAISLAIYLCYMIRIHGQLTLACLATTPLLWYATVRFSRLVRPAYERNRELFDRQIMVLSENVQGVNVVKGFARQEDEIGKFDRAVDAVRDQKRSIFKRICNYQPLIGFITQVNLIVLMGYGGFLVVNYERASSVEAASLVGLSIGQFLVFAGLLQQFSGQVANLSSVADSMQQSLTCSRRVFEVIDAPVEIQNSPNSVRIQRLRGEVAFDNVSFAYHASDPVLENLSFRVEPGQCVAVLGTTGSGKSSLLGLVPRFYDVTGGRLLIDGHDVKDINLEDLRRGIGIVFQESFLFSNTIRENIAFGCPAATDEDVVKAAKIAAAHDFIMEMQKGYDTVLRENGSNLSGGQRQRLAIARAVLLEPSILLLDDPTASVDSQTEGEIMEAIENAMESRTTFIVAHRLSTLRKADMVIVLRDGKIAQAGTHAELMKSQGLYQYAAKMQGADEESLRLLNITGIT